MPGWGACGVSGRSGGDAALRREIEALLDTPATADGVFAAPVLARTASAVRDPAASVLTGRRLGVYHLEERIGAGGMGDVDRARDTRLGRDVALKILPSSFASDPERVARFEREARILAALNHPHIAAIYGLEESPPTGEEQPPHALVLELVEGPTLADRLTKGPVPVKEALAIARQIAEALEAAHEHGIIHRDLKPANIKLTRDGIVKVLDFGLAKAFLGDAGSVDLSQVPTVTVDRTQAGVLAGTPAYMSPEQARGRAVDKRADIWAFGCVLYETLTRKQAFRGNTLTDVLAAILDREPDWHALPTTTPSHVRRVLRKCLEKDPRHRLRDIGDARIELEEALASRGANATEMVTPWAHKRRRAVAATGLGLVLGAFTMWVTYSRVAREPTPPAVRHVLLDVRPAKHLADPSREPAVSLNRIALAFSADGKYLAFGAVGDDGPQLYLRALDQPQAQPLKGTEGALNPFFSPDGQWVGFWANGQLKKISISGGPAIPLAETAEPIGASWGSNDVIVYGDTESNELWQVAAAGGRPQRLTQLNREKGEVSHRLPHVLAGGDAVLFTVRHLLMGGWDTARVVVHSLRTGEQRVVVDSGADARYVPTGHLVFARMGTLFAIPFDLRRLEVTGASVPVVQGVAQAINARSSANDTGAAQFAVSDSGSLA